MDNWVTLMETNSGQEEAQIMYVSPLCNLFVGSKFCEAVLACHAVHSSLYDNKPLPSFFSIQTT